jgi:predicted lipoprotein with Yx(FWY)xxD motif
MSITTRPRLAAALAVLCALLVPALAQGQARAHAAATTVLETHRVTGYGPVLAAGNGHTLYMFDRDHPDRSSCSGACARTWRPYLATGRVSVRRGSGLDPKLVGTIRIAGGRRQVVYNRHPLYQYSRERRAGQSAGQARTQFGGDWYMVGPKGRPITCQPGLVCGY